MKMDNGSKLGMILAGLGGCVAVGAFAFTYESALTTFVPIGALLLLAVMFFALAGAFNTTGQWTPRALTIYAFILAGVIMGVTLVEYINVYIGIVEFILAILVIVISNAPETRRFVSQSE